MAVGINVLRRIRRPWGGDIGKKDLLVEFTGNNPYTTSGGDTITAASLGVNSILAIRPHGVYPMADRQYLWNRATGKLMVQVISTAAEAGAIDCSADKVVAYVYAR